MSIEMDVVHPHVDKCIEAFNNAHPSNKIYRQKPAVNMGMGEKGHPDYLLVVCGVMIGMECKGNMRLKNGAISTSKSNLPTAHQTKRLREIDEAGGYACVVDTNNMQLVGELLEKVHRYATYHDAPIVDELPLEFPTLNYKQYCKQLRSVDL